ncbi:Bctrs33 [Botrytis cinerea B05.10]|uniref:Bctrs33 n=4 Tax=Sclerotiniaceae TaxID=28983 RepID=A0A384K7N5_BOTFB|nr:Bctrs33 [Botrytis cinerea B05.10]ATZ58809.1 Bctrs33 [Botrytis cinerea B05.10]EMR80957.1 putative bet3 family protein [Botrytis cinerea BcDW1]CCD56048.1 similar to BET3 family protein [Botrytis cinerea T4]
MSFESPLPPYNASDPTATFLNSSCLDLLLIELVPLAYRTVHALDAPSPPSSSPNPSAAPKMEEEEERERVFFRLESLGYRVGLGLVERFSKDRPRFTDTLDVIKFLCKDLWMLVFRKQIDNLKTNHRGVYVLTDHSFRPFARMSTEPGGNAVIRAQPFLYFPCGIIRGALASMGINATVHAETTELPGATFQIKSIVNTTTGK